jgi:hypothetical protein
MPNTLPLQIVRFSRYWNISNSSVTVCNLSMSMSLSRVCDLAAPMHLGLYKPALCALDLTIPNKLFPGYVIQYQFLSIISGYRNSLVRPHFPGPILIVFGVAYLIITLKQLSKFQVLVFIFWLVMIATNTQTHRQLIDYRDPAWLL